MEKNNDFVAFEYKNITVKRDSVTIYTDCLSNFGWTLVDERDQGPGPAVKNMSPVTPPVTVAVSVPVARTEDTDLVALKFKRDRQIASKLELNRLERKCEDALSAISGMERKDNAFTMGIALGSGIVGTAILALAVHSFMSANTIIGVFLAVLGVAGWGIGFFANLKMGKKRASKTEPMIQAQLDVAYSACEQAHALLAS